MASHRSRSSSSTSSGSGKGSGSDGSDGAKHRSAITACAQKVKWESALDLLAKAAESRHADLKCHTSAITACGRGLQVGFALRLLATIQSMCLSPSLVTYNALLSALETRGRWRSALDLLRAMRARRMRPDAVSYTACISTCARLGRWKLAALLISDMRAEDIALNVVSCTALVKAYERGSAWSRALSSIGLMPSLRLDPNFVTFHTALSACKARGLWPSSFAILDEMQVKSLRPNAIGYSFILSTCESAMQRVGVRATLRALGGLMRDFLKADHEAEISGESNSHAGIAFRALASHREGCLSQQIACTLRRHSHQPVLSVLSALRHRAWMSATWMLLRTTPLRCIFGERVTSNPSAWEELDLNTEGAGHFCVRTDPHRTAQLAAKQASSEALVQGGFPMGEDPVLSGIVVGLYYSVVVDTLRIEGVSCEGQDLSHGST